MSANTVEIPKYPLYLDSPMMISFLAALEDGVATEMSVQIVDALRKGAQGEAEIAAKLSIFGIGGGGAKAKGAGEIGSEQTEQMMLVKRHTEASLFNKLRAALLQNNLVLPMAEATLETLRPGSIIEASGRVNPSAIEQVIAMMGRMTQLFGKDFLNQDSNLQQGKNSARGNRQQHKSSQNVDPVEMLRRIDEELKGADMKDLHFVDSNSGSLPMVLTLSQDYGTGRTIDSLLECEVTVLGKVSAVVKEGEINLLRRSSLGYMPGGDFDAAFNELLVNPLLANSKLEVRIPAPVIQVIPMAIFV